jgi:hypothetical protein
VLVDIDAIPAGDVEGSPFVMLTDVRLQDVVDVIEPGCRAGLTQVSMAIDTQPEVARVTGGMVVVAWVWEGDVAHARVGIPRYEERVVPDHDMPCHIRPPRSVFPSL